MWTAAKKKMQQNVGENCANELQNVMFWCPEHGKMVQMQKRSGKTTNNTQQHKNNTKRLGTAGICDCVTRHRGSQSPLPHMRGRGPGGVQLAMRVRVSPTVLRPPFPWRCSRNSRKPKSHMSALGGRQDSLARFLGTSFSSKKNSFFAIQPTGPFFRIVMKGGPMIGTILSVAANAALQT